MCVHVGKASCVGGAHLDVALERRGCRIAVDTVGGDEVDVVRRRERAARLVDGDLVHALGVETARRAAPRNDALERERVRDVIKVAGELGHGAGVGWGAEDPLRQRLRRRLDTSRRSEGESREHSCEPGE